MNDRLVLVILIIILWLFLVFWNIYARFIPSTLLILGVIIAYCIILGIAQAFQKSKKVSSPAKSTLNDYTPFVNIFIPAHNEGLVLRDTIENLVNIDYPHYDILIIDDRSNDNTLEIAKELSQKYSEKVKFNSRAIDAFPGKSAVLNEAFAITSGDVICVFDADARVNTDFLKNILPYLADEKTAAVQARKIISNKDVNLLTACQYFEYCTDTYVQLGKDSLNGAVELRGNGELIKRSALERVNGWNNYTLTDDLDVSTKLHLANYAIRFCSNVMVYEEAVTSFNVIIKQRKRWAEGSIRRYMDYFKDIVSSKNISFRASLDMVAYFSELVLPIWIISDFFIQVISISLWYCHDILTLAAYCSYCSGIEGYLSYSILMNSIVIAVLFTFFVSILFTSILKFEQCNILKALKESIITAIYLIILWTIVVSAVVVKIIFMKKDMNWYKTQRSSVT